MNIDDRKLKILSAVVDEYIKTGEPVGSKAIASMLDVPVSSATIRNDMAMLEKLGFLEQPHTSAGRVPSYIGYRLYIERLMQPADLTQQEKDTIDQLLANAGDTADEVLQHSAQVLSTLTGCATVTTSHLPQFSVISRVEVIPAGRRLYALLIVTSGGTVKNKVCRVAFDLTYDQIEFFATVVNKNLNGVKIEELTHEMIDSLTLALGSYVMTLSPLLNAVYELSEQFAHSSVDIQGEKQLLTCSDFNAVEIVNFLTTKNDLGEIMSQAFDGIQVVFGKENNRFAITNSSLVLAKYNAGKNDAGAFGIIGPIRLDYAKIIPYIQYFSDSVTRLLSEAEEEEQ